MRTRAELERVVDGYLAYPLMSVEPFRVDVAARFHDLLRSWDTRQGELDQVFRRAYLAALGDYLAEHL